MDDTEAKFLNPASAILFNGILFYPILPYVMPYYAILPILYSHLINIDGLGAPEEPILRGPQRIGPWASSGRNLHGQLVRGLE